MVVSPEDDIELRRLRLTNRSRSRRSIEFTTYTEVVMAPAAADAVHPAFSKLFVQTEVLDQPSLILCSRRPRSAEEQPPWMFHLVAVHAQRVGPASHETDRSRFIGRGRGPHAPAAMRDAAPLSGASGSVLDPIAATRRVITLEPEETALVDIVYGAADTRDACLALAHKAMDRRLADRAFELAWTHSQVILRQLNASEADAQTFARLANTVVYSQPTLRAEASALLRNRRGQSGLWGYAISGDLPIVLLQISNADSIELVRQMVQAHAWWRLKGLAVDLVIWNEERDVYRQRLQEQMLGLIATSLESHAVDRPGGIFVRHAEHIAPEDRVLLQAVARAVISDRLGSLEQQVTVKRVAERRPPLLQPAREPQPAVAAPSSADTKALTQFNGTGGFSPDGREYVIWSDAEHRPPAPWVNVIANPRFGTVVSEAGSAYTWCENAHELRLTPWHNDPVADTGGEEIFLRDEESGQVWSPTSQLPAADPREEAAGTPYLTRHGFGYSVFEHDEAGVHSELTVFVALDDAVKFSRLVLRNDSVRHRRLSATGYVEWVLGELREQDRAAHPHRDRVRQRRALRAQPLQQRLRRLDRIPRCRSRPPRERIGHRRPRRVHRPQWLAAPAGGDAPGAPVRSHRCRARPVQRDPGGDRAGAGQVAGDRLSPWHGPQRRRGRPAGAALPRRRGGAGGARRGRCALAPCTGRRAGRHARFVVEPAGQRLADVPDHRLPDVGPQRLLPVRRGVRLPRSAAGRDGGGPHPAPAAARAPAVQCEPTVRRGRRSALVASAGGARRSHGHFGRLPLAAPRAVPLRAGDQRHRRARRGRGIPRRSTGGAAP